MVSTILKSWQFIFFFIFGASTFVARAEGIEPCGNTGNDIKSHQLDAAKWQLKIFPENPQTIVKLNVPESPDKTKLFIVAKGITRESIVRVVQPWIFEAGRVYQLCGSFRSLNSKVEIQWALRDSKSPYSAGAVDYAEIEPTLNRPIAIRGGFPIRTQGEIVLQLLTPGKIEISATSVRDITDNVRNSTEEYTKKAGIITAPEFFGIHVNKLGKHTTWPSLDFGLLRLWDTGTTWADLVLDPSAIRSDALREGNKAEYRLAYYLKYVAMNCRNCSVMYTLAVTPDWAASDKSKPFIGGRGSTSPPADISAWRSYVIALAKRFENKIRYWEIWNEADVKQHFSGTYEDLLRLTKEAHSILRELSPEAKLSSPNITARGLGLLDQFLDSGGASFVDFISWHLYPSAMPEMDIPTIVALQDVVNRHQISHFPIFNTEGRVTRKGIPNAEILSTEQLSTIVARSYLVQWSFGIDSFSWYMWDDEPKNSIVILNGSGPPKYERASPEGMALGQIMKWLKNSSFVGRKIEDTKSGAQIWKIYIARTSGTYAMIGWTTEGSLESELKADESFRHSESLDGKVNSVVSRNIELTTSPTMYF